MYLLKPSFAGGEISPALYGRTDFAKYDNGAAVLKNFYVQRYGGIANRPGTKFISKIAGFAVLRPFKYSSSENYMIVFSDRKIEVYSKNETLVATLTNSPYTASELRLIKYTQSADVMFLVHPNHPPMTLTRNSNTNWRLAVMDISGGPFEDPNTSSIKISASARTGTVTLTASASYFTSDMVGNILQLGHAVGGQYVKGVPNASGNKTATLQDVVKSGATTVLQAVPTGYALQTINVKLGDTNVGFTYNASQNSITVNDYLGMSVTVTRTFLYSASNLQIECVPGGTVYVESFGFWKGNFSLEKYVDGAWTKVRSQNGNHSSNYNFTDTNHHSEIISYRITSTEFDTTIWDGENDKQTGHVTLQSFGQDYYGQVKITAVASGTSATASVIRKLGDTKATNDFSISPWSTGKGYPVCATFFEDRLTLAGSKAHKQSFWGSKSGDYFNFGTSVPSLDTDAITGTLNGGEMNGIKYMIPFAELIMLTAGSEHKVTGVNNQALAPGKVRSQAQEYRGISDVAPVKVGSRIIYIQQAGDIVRDLAYTYEADKYTGDDINLLAQHLFERHKLVSMCYQQTPNSIVWFVRDDGLLLGMTYLKEQDVYAWHQHSTQDGEFIDVASISGDTQDDLWCVVKRGSEYFLEVMAEREKSQKVEDQYFVDCGVQISNSTGVRVVNNLGHLEGKTVAVLADGFVLPQQKVVNGQIDLGHNYKKISVGLPIESLMKTLPLELQAQDGSTISRKKRVAKVMLLFKESTGGRFGLKENKMDEIKWRSTEAYGEAVQPFSGKQYIWMPSATYEDTVQITVKQNEPLPMTILAVVPEMQVGG